MGERDSIRDIIGTSAAQAAAISTPILSPLVISSLIVGLGIGELEAGELITLELLIIGVSSIALAPLMPRISFRILAAAAALFLVAAHTLSSQTDSLDSLFLWRILAGLCIGCLTAAVNAAIAQSRSPALLYGLAWAAGYTTSAILALLVTRNNEVVSYQQVYFALAMVMVVLLPLLWLMPRHQYETSTRGKEKLDFPPGIMLLIAVTLIGLSMMAYYAFLGQLAISIGSTAKQTGWILALVQVAGIIGGLSVAPVSNRLGVLKSLLVVAPLHAIAIMLAIWTPNTLVLGLAAFFEAVLFIIMTPLMFTLAANIDKQGRWAAAAAGTFTLSTAFGPIIGAVFIEHSGYSAIAWMQVLALLPALLIFIWVNSKIKK